MRKKFKRKGLFGSANGNRTERLSVQLSSVGSICLQTRSTGIAGTRQKALRMRDVVTRLSLGVSWDLGHIWPRRCTAGRFERPLRPRRNRNSWRSDEDHTGFHPRARVAHTT
jgi:hypothetical protein